MDFDYSTITQDDAKMFAKTFINWMMLGIVFYASCFLACFSGCCLCAIKKARYNQKLRETYQQSMQQPANSIATGVANAQGFHQLAESEPSEDNINYNNNIVARGVAINHME